MRSHPRFHFLAKRPLQNAFEQLESRAVMTSVVDLNGDAHQDVLTAFEWYENDGKGSFTVHDLTSVTTGVVGSGDFDGDGDFDLLTRETNLPTTEARWLENRQGDFTTVHRLSGSFEEATEVVDLDGDGDQDILDGRWDVTYPNGVFTRTETVRLWENQGGGNFAAPKRINIGGMPGQQQFTDWDHDGPLNSLSLRHGSLQQEGDRYFFEFDVISKEYGSTETQSLKSFEVVIDPVYPGPYLSDFAKQPISASWADMNGDGESDLVITWTLGVFFQVDVMWYQGNGQGQFDDGHTLLSYSNEGSGTDFSLIDLDGDKDLDALVRDVVHITLESKSSFLLNTGQGFERANQYPGYASAIGPLNSDGVMDLVFADMLNDEDHWIDGRTGVRGNLSMPPKAMQIFYAQSGARQSIDVTVVPFYGPYDLDADRRITQSDVDQLLINLGTPRGDSNLDGVFNSADLLLVFQAGEYLDETLSNSRWETGDWNGDGEFDTSDLVFAFQAGGYTV